MDKKCDDRSKPKRRFRILEICPSLWFWIVGIIVFLSAAIWKGSNSIPLATLFCMCSCIFAVQVYKQ